MFTRFANFYCWASTRQVNGNATNQFSEAKLVRRKVDGEIAQKVVRKPDCYPVRDSQIEGEIKTHIY